MTGINFVGSKGNRYALLRQHLYDGTYKKVGKGSLDGLWVENEPKKKTDRNAKSPHHMQHGRNEC